MLAAGRRAFSIKSNPVGRRSIRRTCRPGANYLKSLAFHRREAMLGFASPQRRGERREPAQHKSVANDGYVASCGSKA
jgi:hypothetical protein